MRKKREGMRKANTRLMALRMASHPDKHLSHLPAFGSLILVPEDSGNGTLTITDVTPIQVIKNVNLGSRGK